MRFGRREKYVLQCDRYVARSRHPRREERDLAPAQQLGRFVRAARGAFSGSTGRALRSDLAIYAGLCAERGERPLPATPATIAAFVDAKAEMRAPATVRRYVTSIAIAHRALGLEKTVKSPLVGLALKRMHRKKGRRQDQATGLTWPLRQRLRAAAAWLGLSHRTLEGYRVSGGGPDFHRFGNRVRYRRSDLDAWAAERRASTTAQAGVALGDARRHLVRLQALAARRERSDARARS